MQHFHGTGQEHEIDLVCEMKVDPQNPSFISRYVGKIYFLVQKRANSFVRA